MWVYHVQHFLDYEVGGWGPWQAADEYIQEMVDNLQSHADEALGMLKFEAISYRSQTVAGMKYHIKVNVANEMSIVMLTVFRNLDDELTVENVEWLHHGL